MGPVLFSPYQSVSNQAGWTYWNKINLLNAYLGPIRKKMFAACLMSGTHFILEWMDHQGNIFKGRRRVVPYKVSQIFSEECMFWGFYLLDNSFLSNLNPILKQTLELDAYGRPYEKARVYAPTLF